MPTTAAGSTELTQELYRYIDVFNLGDYGVANNAVKDELAQKIENTGFYAGMVPANVTVTTHRVHNYVVYQTYEVEVTYQLKLPVKFMFTGNPMLLNLTARDECPIVDTSEFIRNVDMAVDYFERTEPGENLQAKLKESYERIDQFINGPKRDPSEAVAGGVNNKVDISQACSDKIKEYYDKYGADLPDDKKDELVKELQEIYENTSIDQRGDLLIPKNGKVVKMLKKNPYTGLYEVEYNWEGIGTVEGTRKMKVLEAGKYFDRVGSIYGSCVGEVNSDGSTPEVEARSIPYYFTESSIVDEPSYHRYKVNCDFTEENIYEQIDKSSLSDDEKAKMKNNVKTYYKESRKNYGEGDGLAYGEIKKMFDSPGGGYQYDMPLNMKQLMDIGMITEVHDF